LDTEGHAFVRDEYSTNWTVRNGSRLTPGAECRLRDGDRVRLGSQVCGLVQLVPSGHPIGVDGTRTPAGPHTRRG
jgi:predicted component of type VI protein secretion system